MGIIFLTRIYDIMCSEQCAIILVQIYILSVFKSDWMTKCDPPYDFRDKGDNTLTTCLHLKTKDIDYNTLTEHARAHFNEPKLLFHTTH